MALLEDLVKDSQLESEIQERDKKFSLLQDQKLAELESFKSKFNHTNVMLELEGIIYMYYESLDHLAAVHLQKVREFESKQALKAKERQAIFEQAFETEILQYKQSGIIPSNLNVQSVKSVFKIKFRVL